MMNETDPKNTKTIYIHEDRRSSENEINLIDIALIFVRRWKIMTSVTILCVLTGTATVFLKPVVYTHRATLQIGSQLIDNVNIPFESAQTVLAKLEYSLIPQTLNEYKKSKPDIGKIPNITAHSPKNTQIIVLVANTTNDGAQIANDLLLNIIDKLTKNHDQLIESISNNLINLREDAKTELDDLEKRADGSIEDKKILVERIGELETRLANIKMTEMISPPIKSLQPAGTNRNLIVLFSAMVGIFFAILSAITIEFIEKVKERSRENDDAASATD